MWASTLLLGPKSLYLATPLAFKPPTGGFPGTIAVKFSVDVNGWPMYQMAQKYCRKCQPGRTLQTDRQTNGRQHIANVNVSSRSLKRDYQLHKNSTLQPYTAQQISSIAQHSLLIPLLIVIAVAHPENTKLEMWANAQRDGRPAKHR